MKKEKYDSKSDNRFKYIVIYLIILTVNVVSIVPTVVERFRIPLLVINLVYEIFMLILIIVAFRENFRNLSNRNQSILKEMGQILWEVFDGLINIVLLLAIMSVVLSKLGISTGESVNQAEIAEFLKNPKLKTVMIVLVVFTGPISEEVAFRYIPSKIFNNKVLYVIVSSLIFAALHCISSPIEQIPLLILNYLPISVYLAYRYAKTEDIFITSAIHMTFNGLATLGILFT